MDIEKNEIPGWAERRTKEFVDMNVCALNVLWAKGASSVFEKRLYDDRNQEQGLRNSENRLGH